MNRAAFIRSLPITLPVAEVVARGKAKGMEISNQYVSNLRWEMKKKGGATKTKAARKSAVKKGAPSKKVATEFLRLALQIGFTRAKALLAAAT